MRKDAIDYKFISDLEGGRKTTGYVPDGGSSRSGVTIATGFDLGQRSARDLIVLGLSGSLANELGPYLELRGVAAIDFLEIRPLNLSEGEARSIDRAVKVQHVGRLKEKYISSMFNGSDTPFARLPHQAQTAIASVAFQYGVDLNMETPKFWQAACKQDWQRCVEILNDFHDRYPTRRRKEAALLAELLPAGVEINEQAKADRKPVQSNWFFDAVMKLFGVVK